MRLVAVLVLGSLALAGCQEPPDPPGWDACSVKVCQAEPSAHPDWVLPEGAQAILTFEDRGRMTELQSMHDGWFWVRSGEQTTLEHWHDGRLFQHPMEAGITARGAVVDGDVVWAVVGESLLQWIPHDETSRTWPVGTARLLGPAGDDLLLWNDGTTVLWHDGNTSSVGMDGMSGPAAADGGTLIFVRSLGEAHPTSEIWIQDLTTGSLHRIGNATEAAGTWARPFASGGLGYVVYDDAGPVEMFEVDRATHEVTSLGLGDEPVFHAAGLFFVAQDEGDPPHVRFRNVATGAEGTAFYLQPRTSWTTTETGVAWIEPPSTTPLIIEAPNPTPFALALYER